MALRFQGILESGMQPSHLLEPKWEADVGNNLWGRVINTVQVNLLSGGLIRPSASGRLTRTRPIRVHTHLRSRPIGCVSAETQDP